MSLPEWRRLAAEVLEKMRHAEAHLDGADPDVDGAHSFVMDAAKALRELDHQLSMQGAPADWPETWGRTWFHEATLLHAFADSLTSEPILVDGTYRWRVRSVEKPPLKMPEADRDNRDGARLEIELGCNTASVYLTVSCDSTYNTHDAS